MKKNIIILLFLLFQTGLMAQVLNDSIASRYINYSRIPQEVIHLHLNKSAFLNGEDLGFTAYVFDRKNKRPSILTKNLYCQLISESGKVVKSKLYKVDNGFTTNVIKLDSTLNPGLYKIRAFTNFMRNFKEPYFFESTIKINDKNATGNTRTPEIVTQIDVQFLAESGHLLSGVDNVVGIVAKSNNRAFEINGGVILEDGNPLTGFSTSNLGTGRIVLRPKKGAVYTAKYLWNGNEFESSLPTVENIGLVLNVKEAADKVLIVIRTNDASLNAFKALDFNMAIHNGATIQTLPVKISKSETILAAPLDNLDYGVNVFTLFDSGNNPIAERSYFNYEKLPLIHVVAQDLSVNYDSVQVALNLKSKLKKIDSMNNFSVSIVPVTSSAINENNRLVVNALLKPYVKGYIENPWYYFDSITRRTKFDMDNLMITQGWTGYNWDNIFNATPKFDFPFELGISMSIKTNNQKNKQFMIYPLQNSNTQIIQIEDIEQKFYLNNLFPEEDDKVEISAMDQKGQLSRPKISLEFSPNIFPSFNQKPLPQDYQVADVYINNDKPLFDRTAQELNEIVLVVDKDEKRRDSIVSTANGIVDYFTDLDRAKVIDMASYLQFQGYEAYFDDGYFFVVDRSPSKGDPVFIIDNQIYNDPSLLYNFEMNTIDYVEIDTQGVFNGRNFGGDIIKITTDPTLRSRNSKNLNASQFKVPLSFAKNRKYYTPNYLSYEDDAFKRLGTVYWKGDLTLTSAGNLNFSIPYRGLEEYKVVIEGMDINGTMISSIATMKLMK